MATLIALLIFLGTLAGILGLIVSKIPLLREMPFEEAGQTGFFSLVKEKLKKLPFKRYFSLETILQKILLRAEKKTRFWLAKLRQRSAQKSKALVDTYWQELKKLTHGSYRPATPVKRAKSSDEEAKKQEAEATSVAIKIKKPRVRRPKKDAPLPPG